MKRSVEELVTSRAGGRCEYCRMPQSAYVLPFQIDHIIAEKHAGPTVGDNLALACTHCNRHKGPNIAGIDPDSGRVCRLYNPRRDVWRRHFRLTRAGIYHGRTAVGRTTVFVLNMNAADVLPVRRGLIAEGDELATLVSE